MYRKCHRYSVAVKNATYAAKNLRNLNTKKWDVSRHPISKTNYLKTNLLKQIKKYLLNYHVLCP